MTCIPSEVLTSAILRIVRCNLRREAVSQKQVKTKQVKTRIKISARKKPAPAAHPALNFRAKTPAHGLCNRLSLIEKRSGKGKKS